MESPEYVYESEIAAEISAFDERDKILRIKLLWKKDSEIILEQFFYFCEHERMRDLKENEKFYTINISTKTIAYNYTYPSPYTRICINKLI